MISCYDFHLSFPFFTPSICAQGWRQTLQNCLDHAACSADHNFIGCQKSRRIYGALAQLNMKQQGNLVGNIFDPKTFYLKTQFQCHKKKDNLKSRCHGGISSCFNEAAFLGPLCFTYAASHVLHAGVVQTKAQLAKAAICSACNKVCGARTE